MHVYVAPFQQRKAQDEKNTLYVRHAIKKYFPEIATSAFCTRSPEITAKKIKSHHEVKIFAVAKTQKNKADDIRVGITRGINVRGAGKTA
jgi:hypothetical protein